MWIDCVYNFFVCFCAICSILITVMDSNFVSMIIFLYGKDTYRSRGQLQKIEQKFIADRDPQKLNTQKIVCKDGVEQAVLGAIYASPFLAEKRMVILENCLVAMSDSFLSSLEEKIKANRVPTSTVLVFWESDAVFKKKVKKSLSQVLMRQPYSQKFDHLNESQLLSWVSVQVEKKEGHIDRLAIRALVDRVGSDMWRLSGLIDQLVAYTSLSGDSKKSRCIEVQDVNAFVSPLYDDSIFSLVDSVIAKNPKQVFGMLGQQYTQGKDPLYVFAMIVRQVRILLQMRDIFEKEAISQSDVLAKRLSLHPFVVKKTLAIMKKYTMKDWVLLHRVLLELDIQIKTGGGDPRLLMDVFVAQWCVAK